MNTAVHILAVTQDAKSQNLAAALKHLTEAVHGSEELTPEQKKENLDLIAALATAAQTPPEKRSQGVLKSIIGTLSSALSAAGTLVSCGRNGGQLFVFISAFHECQKQR